MLSRISANGLYKTALKLNMTNLKIVTNRSMHGACTRKNANKTMRFIFDPDKQFNILRASFVRHASDGVEPYSPSILDNIPDVPTFSIPTPVETIVYHTNGELAFSSIGLGGYGPVGLLQYGLEFLHIGCGIPWWAAVATGTLIVRLTVLPLLIDGIKTSDRMQHHFPMIQKYQEKISEARQLGDTYEATTHMYSLQDYMKKNNVSVFRSTIPMLVQMPIFVSFFVALRQMSNKPVESLTEGGLWWFTDLTLADPYYVLPILTTATMALVIHRGAEGTAMNQKGFMKIALRLMPVVVFPFTVNFSTVIFCYWLSSNLISLIQAELLKTSIIRNKLNLPKKKPVVAGGPAKKGFVKELTDAWTNAKVMKQLNERDRANEKAFKGAASSTPIKTYKYDPTKQRIQAQVLAKKREI